MNRLIGLVGFIIMATLLLACSGCKRQSNVDPDDLIPGRVVIATNPDGTPKIVYYYKVDDQGNITNEKVREIHYLPGKKKYVDGTIHNDQRHGSWKAYHENGKIQTEASYIDGKENGEYKVYRDNGAFLYTGHYDHGICVGEWKKYSKEGKVIKTVIADSNTVVCGGCEKCKRLRKERGLKHVTF